MLWKESVYIFRPILIDYINILKFLANAMRKCKCTGADSSGLYWAGWGHLFFFENICRCVLFSLKVCMHSPRSFTVVSLDDKALRQWELFINENIVLRRNKNFPLNLFSPASPFEDIMQTVQTQFRRRRTRRLIRVNTVCLHA